MTLAEKTFLSILLAAAAVSMASPEARAATETAPVTEALLPARPLSPTHTGAGQEQVRRVVVGKPPCIFVSTSKRRGSLGVQLTDLTPELRRHFGAPEDAGVMVARVVPESPAEKAGVNVGDILVSVDGDKVSSSGDVARKVRRKARGDVVELEIQRGGKATKLSATIEERERPEIDIGGIFTGDCEEFDFHIDEEAIRDAVESATRQFRSPEWKSRLERFERLGEGELEQKLKELEKRLQELEKELERKNQEPKKPTEPLI